MTAAAATYIGSRCMHPGVMVRVCHGQGLLGDDGGGSMQDLLVMKKSSEG